MHKHYRRMAKARYTLSFRKVQPPSEVMMMKTLGKNGEWTRPK